MRPIGGVVIASIGDRLGRRPALLLTIILMGIATVGIGLLPTADTIGAWAPVLLVFLRALQGFGAGAELSGALTVAAEYTAESRRGFFTSIINMSAGIGSAAAMLAFLAVAALPSDVLLGWAWRVPFLLSAVLFLLALYIRKRLEDAAIAGPTPFIAAALITVAGGQPYLAALFIGACFAISLVSMLVLRRTGGVRS